VDWQQSLAARLVIAPGPLLARSGQHCARDTVKHLTAYEVLLDKRLDIPDGKVGRKLREGFKCFIEGQTGWLRSSAGPRHHEKGQTLSTNVWSLRQLSYHKILWFRSTLLSPKIPASSTSCKSCGIQACHIRYSPHTHHSRTEGVVGPFVAPFYVRVSTLCSHMNIEE
jgi:hypothetical protein